MGMNRRGFLATAGLGSAGLLAGVFGVNVAPSVARAQAKPLRTGKLSTTICPYCGVGCGMLVTTDAGKVVTIEGDPDHPISQGSMCSKSAAMVQIANNERRMSKVLYRAPGAAAWEEKEWDWAIARIAEKVKATRDATFVEKDKEGRTVNRTEGIACLGGAALDNEECYTYSKLARAMGIVYLEHQARI